MNDVGKNRTPTNSRPQLLHSHRPQLLSPEMLAPATHGGVGVVGVLILGRGRGTVRRRGGRAKVLLRAGHDLDVGASGVKSRQIRAGLSEMPWSTDRLGAFFSDL